MDMEEETRRELSSLQREREMLQAKEKRNLDAIDEVRGVVFQRTRSLSGAKMGARFESEKPPARVLECIVRCCFGSLHTGWVSEKY